MGRRTKEEGGKAGGVDDEQPMHVERKQKREQALRTKCASLNTGSEHVAILEDREAASWVRAV